MEDIAPHELEFSPHETAGHCASLDRIVATRLGLVAAETDHFLLASNNIENLSATISLFIPVNNARVHVAPRGVSSSREDVFLDSKVLCYGSLEPAPHDAVNFSRRVSCVIIR